MLLHKHLSSDKAKLAFDINRVIYTGRPQIEGAKAIMGTKNEEELNLLLDILKEELENC